METQSSIVIMFNSQHAFLANLINSGLLAIMTSNENAFLTEKGRTTNSYGWQIFHLLIHLIFLCETHITVEVLYTVNHRTDGSGQIGQGCYFSEKSTINGGNHI